MVHPAELFEPAERMLVEVIGRIRGRALAARRPPVLDVAGADAPATLRELVARQAGDDARLPALLAGRTADRDEPIGDDPHRHDRPARRRRLRRGPRPARPRPRRAHRGR
jgi:hypothetical protein